MTLSSIVMVWWGIFCSAPLFIVVLLVAERPSTLQQPELLPILALVAASTCALGAILPAQLFKQALSQQRFDVIEREDPNQPTGFGEPITIAKNPEQARSVLLGVYSTKTILGCALGESVSLFGLVLGFLGAPLVLCLPFFVAAALVQAYHYPRLPTMLAGAERVLGIRF